MFITALSYPSDHEFLSPPRFLPCLKFVAVSLPAIAMIASSASAAVTVWAGISATADANPGGDISFTVGDLDDAADGGSFVIDGGQVPEFRIEFNGFDPENPRMVNTWLAPIALSDELAGEGLRQFAFNEEIGPGATWGAQGFLETPTGNTVWNSN